MWLFIRLAAFLCITLIIPIQGNSDVEDEHSRKILGSSVVTSVSVIMNAENGSKVVFADAAGKPLPKPALGSDIASPINLLNPDKYEFYTFDDNGDLVKRLMTKEEIHGIVASEDIDPFSVEAFPSEEYTPERRVEDVVNNVQNVLKEEIQSHKDNMNDIVFDVGQWSMILPTILGTNFEQTMTTDKPTTIYTATDTMITDRIIIPSTNATTTKPIATSTETQPEDSNPWDAFIKIATSKPASGLISKKPSTTNIMFTPTSFTSSQTQDLQKESIDTSQTIAKVRSTTVRSTTQKQRPSTQKQKIKITTQAKTPTTQKVKLTTTTQKRRPTTQKQRSTTQKPTTINTSSAVTSASPITDLSQSETSSIFKVEKTENSSPIYYSSTTVQPFSKGTSTTLRGISSTSNPVFLTLAADSTSKSGVSKPAAFMTSTVTSKPTNAPNKLTTASSNKIYPTNEKLTSYVLVNTLESKSTESQTNLDKIPPTTEATVQTTKNSPTSQFSATETETVKYETPSTTTSDEDLTSMQTTTPGTSTQPEDTKITESLKIKESIEIENPMKETTETTERMDTKSTIAYTDMPSTTTTTDNFKTFESTSIDTSTTDSATSSTELVSDETTSMSMITKIAASEILNQLLLTTNNIYELNKELSEKTTELVPNDDERPETTTPTSSTTNLSNSPAETNTDISSTVETSTSTSTSTSTYVTGTDSDETTSEYQSVINEAEKIMSQTSNYEELTTNTNTLNKINSTLNNSANKTMSQVMSEAATIASDILTGQADEDATTTEFVISENETAMLSDSVEKLLSQILNTEDAGLTTTEYSTTNSPNITTMSFDKERDEELITSTTNRLVVPELKTGDVDDGGMTTQTEFMSTTSTSTNMDSEISTTIAPSTTTSTSTSTSTSTTTENTIEDFTRNYQSTLPFIETLNRDGSDDEEIILAVKISDARRNLTKPAKADTSLEYDYLENFESLKNKYYQSNHNDENTQKEVQLTETIDESNTEIRLTTHQEASTTERLTTEKDAELLSTTSFPTDYETTSIKYTETSSVTTTDVMESTTLKKNPFKSKDSITGPDVEATEDPAKEITTQKTFTTTEMDYKTTTKQEDPDEVSWTLVSTISPHNDRASSENPIQKPTLPVTSIVEPPKPVELVPKPLQGFGLEDSTIGLEPDIIKFVELSNELAFGFWKSVTNGISKARSVVTSPFAATSLLAMVFLGARGSTSGEMNDILKLDDMVTFNPHLVFKDVSESIEVGKKSGVATAVMLRELYSDRAKGKLLGFYKARVKQFYDGHVEEVSFREIGDIIRRRTNLLIKKQSNNKITEFLKNNNVAVKPPLAAVGVSVYHSDCSEASTSGRDGELHFVVLPSIRQRRLVPIPAVVYKDGFLAGYEASLDATAVSLGTKEQPTSIIFIIPGQQGIAAPGDGLARLEKRLIESAFKNGAWSRLLRSLIPRPGLEVQIPRFSHRSIINATVALKKMGLKDLFDPKKADLKGLNGVAHDIHLSDMLQINSFATCGENRIGNTHHSEIYPATGLLRTFRKSKILQQYQMDAKPFYDDVEEPRDYQRAFHDPLHDPSYLNLPLALRPRQARVPETPRLRFDRPFLYVVRHNPTGLIIHMGRFNPRLLP